MFLSSRIFRFLDAMRRARRPFTGAMAGILSQKICAKILIQGFMVFYPVGARATTLESVSKSRWGSPARGPLFTSPTSRRIPRGEHPLGHAAKRLSRARARVSARRGCALGAKCGTPSSAMFFLVFARRQEKSRAKCVRVGASGRRPERWNRVCARGQTLSRALNRARAFRGVPMTPRRLRRRSSFSRTFLSRLSSFFSQFARRPQVLLAVSTLWVARCARISPPRLRARSRATPAPLRRLPTPGDARASPHPPPPRVVEPRDGIGPLGKRLQSQTLKRVV